MKTITTKATNGVSFGTKYVVTAADVTAAEKVYAFDFGVTMYGLAAAVTATTAAGVPVTPAKVEVVGSKITVTLTATPAEGDIIMVVAQRAY